MTAKHKDYDLTEQRAVRRMFAECSPEIVLHLAGYVGGILANKERPADFFYRNLMMNTMVLHEAYLSGVQKFVCLIGGCSYPSHAPDPIKEEYLWEGYPQPESAPYSMAKKMLVVQSESYRRQFGFNSIVLVPGNVYGPYDNFNLEDSHVIPALIRKVYEAKRDGAEAVAVWGSGKPIRDFIYASDAVEGVLLAAETYNSSEIVNISSGEETSIRNLVESIVRLMDFKGSLIWDTSKPDGQARKRFDVTRMQNVLGFKPKTSLEKGLKLTIEWFAKNYEKARL
jgi:GDP-L-fucose synthase